MPYAYPAPRTGTAQDLLRVVTRAFELELERTGAALPPKSGFERRWVEPPFRAAGVVLGGLMRLLPADWSLALQDRLFAALTAPRSYPFDAAAPVLLRARDLAARLERDHGRAPALLALISHPPAMGDLAHLNVALARAALLALRAARGRPCRPRLVAGTDPFSLDTLSLAAEGVYAGFMGTFHLGLDRMSLGGGRPGVSLTPGAAWPVMPSRLMRALGRGGEVGMVLSGGVPGTARVLYGAREWVRRARAESPLRSRPGEARRRLEASPAFRRFRSAAEGTLTLPRGVWGELDAWLMAAAAGLAGDGAEAAAAAALEALAVPETRRAPLEAELRSDLARQTPPRRRLFRLLARRVLPRRPLLLLPVAHRADPLGVAPGEAWSWEAAGAAGDVRARRADAPDAPVEASAGDFAVRFVEENFE